MTLQVCTSSRNVGVSVLCLDTKYKKANSDLAARPTTLFNAKFHSSRCPITTIQYTIHTITISGCNRYFVRRAYTAVAFEK